MILLIIQPGSHGEDTGDIYQAMGEDTGDIYKANDKDTGDIY